MRTWKEEHEREDAITRVEHSVLIGCIGLILIGILYILVGVWLPAVFGVVFAWCLVVGLPLFFKSIKPLTNKVVDFLDKKWENWWRYL